MKLLHYSADALSTPFGTPSAVRSWCDALADEGATVTLVSDEGAPVVAVPRAARSVRVPHRLARMGRGWVKIPERLASLIEEADVVVLHGGWRAANPWAAAAARRGSVPYILTPHGRYDPHIYSRHRVIRAAWWRTIERPMVNRADAVHLFFEDEPSVVPADVPIIVAPNGIEAPPSVTWSGSTDGSLVWLGRLDPEHKGLDLLIEAVRSISPEERPSIDLYGHDWLGGRSLVLDQIQRDGLERWIRLHDPILGDAKWAALAAAKGFVYPSRWEAFGLALAEAVSIGIPSLVTPFPLARFLASRGVATLSDGSPEDLAEKLVAMAASRTNAPTNGPSVMNENFSWPAVARSWLAQVTSLADARKVRRSL